LGQALYSALTDSSQKAIISDIVGKEVKGMDYVIYHAVLGITLFPASLIAGLLYDKINASAPFYFGGTMALLAAVLMIFFTLFYMKKTKKELWRRTKKSYELVHEAQYSV
jgi:MFS family permease